MDMISKYVYVFTETLSGLQYVGLCQEEPEKHMRAYWKEAQRTVETSRKIIELMMETSFSCWESETLYKITAPKEHNYAFATAVELEQYLILALRTYDPYGLNLTMGGTNARSYETYEGIEPNPIYSICRERNIFQITRALVRHITEKNFRKKVDPEVLKEYPGLSSQFGRLPWSPIRSTEKLLLNPWSTEQRIERN
mgnify:CR=1 FL=1